MKAFKDKSVDVMQEDSLSEKFSRAFSDYFFPSNDVKKLRHAASTGDLKTIVRAVELGKIDAVLDEISYIFHRAVQENHFDIARYLLQVKRSHITENDIDWMWTRASEPIDERSIAYLIENKLITNQDNPYYRLVDKAIENGRKDLLQYLLKDVNEEDRLERALRTAANSGKLN